MVVCFWKYICKGVASDVNVFKSLTCMASFVLQISSLAMVNVILKMKVPEIQVLLRLIAVGLGRGIYSLKWYHLHGFYNIYSLHVLFAWNQTQKYLWWLPLFMFVLLLYHYLRTLYKLKRVNWYYERKSPQISSWMWDINKQHECTDVLVLALSLTKFSCLRMLCEIIAPWHNLTWEFSISNMQVHQSTAGNHYPEDR